VAHADAVDQEHSRRTGATPSEDVQLSGVELEARAFGLGERSALVSRLVIGVGATRRIR
jgi:hypothetical protein